MVDWKVEDEGPIANLLNIEITQSKDGKVKLAQTSYIENREARRHPLAGRRGIALSPGGEDAVRRVSHHARRRRAQYSTDEIDDEFRRRYKSLAGL